MVTGAAGMPRVRTLRMLVLGTLLLMVGSAWSQTVSREDRIKAALILKLVKFIEWSPSALPSASAIQVCAHGASGVGEALAAADGKPVRDRTAKYRKLDGLSVNDLKGCHVLYLTAWSKEVSVAVAPLLKTRGSGMLTISDQADFARRGGMIGLTQGENKVGFEINLRATREGGMEPGAPLLELATVVD